MSSQEWNDAMVSIHEMLGMPIPAYLDTQDKETNS